MRRSLSRPTAAIVIAALAVLTPTGCATIADMTVGAEMRRKNQDDLKQHRQSPSEYQQRAQEIDRAFR